MEPPPTPPGEPAPPPASTASMWETPLPPRPDAEGTTPPPEPQRRRWVAVVAVVVCVGFVAGAVALLQRDERSAFPESVGDFPLVQGEVAEDLQRNVEAMMPAGVRMRIAVYGDEINPQVFVFLLEKGFEGVDTTPIDQFFEGAASGFAGAPFGGASLDLTGETQASEGGKDYICAPISSTSVVAPFEGVLCFWRGESAGLLLSTHTTDPSAALVETRVVAEAIDG